MIPISATLPNGTIDTIDVDAIVQENGQFSAQVTQHPVEQGSNVSDHIRAEASKPTFELVISNTPLGQEPVPWRAEDALVKLRQWQRTGALLSFPTSTDYVLNMAIASISWTRDAKTGGAKRTFATEQLPNVSTGGLRLRLGLQHIRFVQNKLTQMAISTRPNVADKTKTGKAPTNELDSDSPLLSTVQGARALWNAFTGG